MKAHRFARARALALAVPLSVAVAAPAAAQERIVGGTAVPDGKYTFMTSLRNSSGSHFCGGTLIAPGWVLTAAHCTEGAQPNQINVVVGRATLSGTGGESRSVSEIVPHPDFDGPVALAHDAALLRLGSDITGIAPIAVGTEASSNSFEAPGNLLTTTGWGTTKSGRPCCPDRMNEVEVPAVSDTDCARAYGSGLHAASMLCAGTRGKDSCQGDSGGPLFETTGSNQYVQVGTVSWGRGCAQKNFPGVYGETNYPVIRNWITSVAGV